MFIISDSMFAIKREINNEAIRVLSSEFYNKTNINHISNIVRDAVLTYIKGSDTNIVWPALAAGGAQGLDAHFGIPKDSLYDRLQTILDIWAQEIRVVPQTIQKGVDRFVFSYKFEAIKADWADVLSSDAGITINKGEKLHWLKWLLLTGDALRIKDYHIVFGNFKRGSRSGKALMRANTEWVIPPEFGPFNSDNNFVTRALNDLATSDKFRNDLENLFQSTIMKAISK